MAISFDSTLREVLDWFHLVEDPFSDTNDTRFMYYTKQCIQTTTLVIDHFHSLRDIVCVSGERGIGKSLLAKRVSELLLPTSYKITSIRLPDFKSPSHFYAHLEGQLGLPEHRKIESHLEELSKFVFFPSGVRKVNAILVIDNAEEIVPEVMGAIGEISYSMFKTVLFLNYEDKLPPLESTFPKGIDYGNIFLKPLTFDETKEMIYFRCQTAGQAQIFSEQAVYKIFAATKGNPRSIVQLGKTLLITLARQKKRFGDEEDVDKTLSIIKTFKGNLPGIESSRFLSRGARSLTNG